MGQRDDLPEELVRLAGQSPALSYLIRLGGPLTAKRYIEFNWPDDNFPGMDVIEEDEAEVIEALLRYEQSQAGR
jgi:hypothetical protein